MRYRPFGRTGLQVSAVGFGCWPMAGDRYGAIEDDEAVKAIHRALDRGVNCVDTAPAYGAGHSEEVVARALEKRRRDVILVTKCGVKVPPPGQPGRSATRAAPISLPRSTRASSGLRTDWVDVLLVHWPDAGTPFEETMRALEEVVASGRARFVGVSNFTGAMLAECMRTRRVDVSQVGYHMLDRRQERGDLSVLSPRGHRRHGLWLARPRPPHRRLHRRHHLRYRARLARQRGGLRPAHLPRRQLPDQCRRGRADPPRGGGSARGDGEPDRAGLGARSPRDQHGAGGARTPAEVDANDAGAELDLSAAERRTIEGILAGAAGRVREFTPLRPAMQPWGEEIPRGPELEVR